MEPENQKSIMQSAAAERERVQQSRRAALEKCWSACETGDMNQFNDIIQEFFGQLGDANIKTLLDRTVIGGWVEATRCLLQQGADLKSVSLSIIALRCRSVEMLELLLEYGLDYTSAHVNILE
jgi:hypothetical protein